VTGKHRDAGLLARYPRLAARIVPAGAALGAVLIILLAAFSVWGLPGSSSGQPTDTAARSAVDRGSRDDPRPAVSASASASPSASASASPSAGPSVGPTVSPVVKPSSSPRVTSTGSCQASYYGDGSHTANGERFDPSKLTAAHKTLPFNTMVKVTNPKNGKSVVVRINDRGPFVSGRCLDLTTAAFQAIASLSSGVLTVKYEVLKS
jgi:rare lipoprotein A